MKPQGLYDPRFEHDSCGVGFVVNVDGKKDHSIIKEGITILKNLLHRGAVGGDMKTGDGAGILLQVPHAFFQKTADRIQGFFRRFFGFELNDPVMTKQFLRRECSHNVGSLICKL